MILKRKLYSARYIISNIILLLRKSFWLPIKHYLKEGELLNLQNTYFKRGLPQLQKNESGTLLCNGCNLCVVMCPSKCIHLLTDEERNPVGFYLESLSCTSCKICEEVCPIDAIKLSNELPKSGHAEIEWVLDHHTLSNY